MKQRTPWMDCVLCASIVAGNGGGRKWGGGRGGVGGVGGVGGRI